MKKLYSIPLSIILLLIAQFSFAQKDSIAEKYANTITQTDLKKHLNILASDEYEGRETGKIGQKMAAEYIANEFQKMGIKEYDGSTYLQQVPLVIQKQKGVSLTINKDTLKNFREYFFFPNISNAKVKSNDIVFAGYGIHDENYSDYENLDVRNKVVMILMNEPQKGKRFWITKKRIPSKWTENYKEKVGMAIIHGASALLIIDPNLKENAKRYHHYLTKEQMMLKLDYDNPKKSIPYFFISIEEANNIMQSTGKTIQEIQQKINKKGKPDSYHTNAAIDINVDRDIDNITTENVLGYIKGSDKKDELIVVTAHYDHIGIKDSVVFNGADDDGSGTVAVLEMAQAFKQAKEKGNGPRRSMLFMTVSGEEKGLLGSEYYSENPVFPLEKTVVNLNIDMIGREDEAHAGDTNFVYIIGSNMLSDDLHAINEKANETYTHLQLDYTYNSIDDPNQFYQRSDHYNFAKHNIPVIFYFNGVHKDYHRSSDTLEKINWFYLEKRTKLVFYTAWELANREERIKLK